MKINKNRLRAPNHMFPHGKERVICAFANSDLVMHQKKMTVDLYIHYLRSLKLDVLSVLLRK